MPRLLQGLRGVLFGASAYVVGFAMGIVTGYPQSVAVLTLAWSSIRAITTSMAQSR